MILPLFGLIVFLIVFGGFGSFIAARDVGAAKYAPLTFTMLYVGAGAVLILFLALFTVAILTYYFDLPTPAEAWSYLVTSIIGLCICGRRGYKRGSIIAKSANP